MKNNYTTEDLLSLYEEKGDGHYGERISQTEHALQCADLAKKDGAPEPLIIAALLTLIITKVSQRRRAPRSRPRVDCSVPTSPSASKRTPVSKARSPCVRGTRRPKSRAWTQERYVITKSCSRVFLSPGDQYVT